MQLRACSFEGVPDSRQDLSCETASNAPISIRERKLAILHCKRKSGTIQLRPHTCLSNKRERLRCHLFQPVRHHPSQQAELSWSRVPVTSNCLCCGKHGACDCVCAHHHINQCFCQYAGCRYMHHTKKHFCHMPLWAHQCHTLLAPSAWKTCARHVPVIVEASCSRQPRTWLGGGESFLSRCAGFSAVAIDFSNMGIVLGLDGYSLPEAKCRPMDHGTPIYVVTSCVDFQHGLGASTPFYFAARKTPSVSGDSSDYGPDNFSLFSPPHGKGQPPRVQGI